MSVILKGARVYTDKAFSLADILIDDGNIIRISQSIKANADKVFDFGGKYIFPGFVDVHVHFREPGFSYKETIKTGSMAASHGGYTTVCTMPNLSPCPDTAANLKIQTDIIEKDSLINILPYGTITKGEMGGELSDMEDMAAQVAGFSDDGRGVQGEEVMLRAMKKAKELDKIIAAHCEVNELLDGGYIHKGEYARLHGHKGICSESEWKQIERDIELCRKTGVKYHVCHISTSQSVALIREAKSQGVNITCETAPHYLVLDDSQLLDEGRFKMNPPVRDEADRQALLRGILDGTIDMIATDHAPHSAEEKSKGLKGSLMGITGLETSFPVLYTELVKKGIVTLERLIELMSIAPARRFDIPCGIKEGMAANLTVFDLDNEYTLSSADFLSMGKATPFEGKKVYGQCVATICKGKFVYEK